MHKLRNQVMDYDWGSRTAIAEFLGRPSPSPGPEAELWIGAHASAPSLVEAGERHPTLAEWIAESPEARLGRGVRERFGDRLPFLLKVLAAEIPLSLQAHPSLEQAREGFAREDALGIPRSARHRHYRDPHHKPEILCALGPFDALCGFRPSARTLALLEALAVPALAPVIGALAREPGAAGVKAAFSALMGLATERAADLVGEVAEACGREAAGCAQAAGGTEAAAQLAWVPVLAKLHPADVGVVASLLLNHVRLEAGQALFLPPRTLHSYLGGTGIELMASSDNVLRGGLTTKPVNVEQLLEVVDFSDRAVAPVAVRSRSAHETEYVTVAPEFCLSTIALPAGRSCRPQRRGPELLLCASGVARIETGSGQVLELRRGESLFVGADDDAYVVTGEAKLFRATVGDD